MAAEFGSLKCRVKSAKLIVKAGSLKWGVKIFNHFINAGELTGRLLT